MLHLTQSDFDQAVAQHELLVVYFRSPNCSACLAVDAVYQELAKDYTDICFAEVDTTQEIELTTDFRVNSTPSLVIFKEGIVIFHHTGNFTKPILVDLLDQAKLLLIQR